MYSNSRRVLKALDEFGINLIARQYYNAVRNIRGDKTAPETIRGLLIALEDAEFVYRTRVEIQKDEFGNETTRKLLQI